MEHLYVSTDLRATPVPWDAVGAAPPASLWVNTVPLDAEPILALRYRLTPRLYATIRRQAEQIDAAAYAGKYDLEKAKAVAERIRRVEEWCQAEHDAQNPEWCNARWWAAPPLDTALPPPLVAMDTALVLWRQSNEIYSNSRK